MKAYFLFICVKQLHFESRCHILSLDGQNRNKNSRLFSSVGQQNVMSLSIFFQKDSCHKNNIIMWTWQDTKNLRISSKAHSSLFTQQSKILSLSLHRYSKMTFHQGKQAPGGFLLLEYNLSKTTLRYSDLT